MHAATNAANACRSGVRQGVGARRPTPAAAPQSQLRRQRRCGPGALGAGLGYGGESAAGLEGIAPALQAAETVAIAAAAALQAVVLLSCAAQARQRQQHQRALTSSQTAEQARSTRRRGQQQRQLQLEPPPAAGAALQAALAPLQGFALVVALGSGALLRRIQAARLAPGGRPTADAAVRLLRLEAALQQQAAASAAATQRLDKLQARVRLSAADSRAPLSQLQQAAASQADAVVRLGEQAARLQRQVAGAEEVMAALQGVGARQFKVCVDALAAVKQQQAVAEARYAQQLSEQQRQLSRLQSQLAQLQLQQHGALLAAAGGSPSTNGGGGAVPDPWLAA